MNDWSDVCLYNYFRVRRHTVRISIIISRTIYLYYLPSNHSRRNILKCVLFDYLIN